MQVHNLAVGRPAGPWASQIYRAGSPVLTFRGLYHASNLSSFTSVLSNGSNHLLTRHNNKGISPDHLDSLEYTLGREPDVGAQVV